MTGTDGEVVFTEDLSSGRVHKRIRVAGSLRVDERCNTDQAGSFRVITTEELSRKEQRDLCEYDFPPEPEDAAA